MVKKSEPVLVAMSTLAGLHILFGGVAGITVLNGYPIVAAIAAVGNLSVAAAQVGVAFYVRGQVTPVDDVPTTVVHNVHNAPARAVPDGPGPL